MRATYETPPTDCPFCGAVCEADWVDVGVGMVQAGPYHCTECHSSEVGPYDKTDGRTDIDDRYGWYKPESPAGSSANTNEAGEIITWKEADTNYRATYGVKPRY